MDHPKYLEEVESGALLIIQSLTGNTEEIIKERIKHDVYFRSGYETIKRVLYENKNLNATHSPE